MSPTLNGRSFFHHMFQSHHCIWSTGIAELLLRVGLVRTEVHVPGVHGSTSSHEPQFSTLEWCLVCTQDYQTYVHIGTRYPGYIRGNPPGTKWHNDYEVSVAWYLMLYNDHHSTKLYWKMSQICCCLYCYECVVQVTMLMATNEWPV